MFAAVMPREARSERQIEGQTPIRHMGSRARTRDPRSLMTSCNAFLSFLRPLQRLCGALHRSLEHGIRLEFPVVCTIDAVETLVERVLPPSAEAGVLSQMGIDGVPRYIRSPASENHLRIPAKRREERFPPRKCPLQRL